VPVTSDAFLTTIRISSDVEELEAVREKVKAEISSLVSVYSFSLSLSRERSGFFGCSDLKILITEVFLSFS
jgi:hypothetical protein